MNKRAYNGLEIAIVGIASRFSGSDTWRKYWDNLVEGKESLRYLSREELTSIGVGEEVTGNPAFVNVRTLFDNKDSFDHNFFNYTPDEAALLNPVHRIFHECVWEALEDAGYDPDNQRSGPIGIFAGARDDLNWKMFSVLKNQNEKVDDFTLHHINNRDYLATLIAYKLNLQGPAFSVNTGCSTSLVAINLACKSLLLGESRMAIAGGALIDTRIQRGYVHREGMINSSDGHCRAFDKDSSGTTVGEGAGVVVLKRLTDALNDNDNIYAVIKGGYVNNDGSRKVGFSAPSIDGQAECIRKALKFAKVEPDTITFVEAHGTGTRLGDPVEMEALKLAYGNAGRKIAVGSVKTNFGHLDAAAGVAGLIKASLSLKFRKLPPTLHFKQGNPEIKFEESRFYVNATLSELRSADDSPLRAAVSSFGIGGTNAHIVLEEPPPVKHVGSVSAGMPVILSAKTKTSLVNYIHKLSGFLGSGQEVNLCDLSFTLATGRKHFEHRVGLVCSSINDLASRLGKLEEEVRSRKANVQRRSVVFVFSGGGSQYQNMGKGLYETNEFFRNEMDKGFSILRNLTGVQYKEILYTDDPGDQRINQMLHTQPLVFLFGYALGRTLMTLGIMPRYMLGHSLGEYVCASLSELLSFEEALRLVIRRGQLMESLAPGRMISVPCSASEVKRYLTDKISLAAINSSEQVVLSGPAEEINRLKDRMEQEGLNVVMLHNSHAAHSSMIEAIVGQYRMDLAHTKFNDIKIPFFSNVSGELATFRDVASPEYWCNHMRGTVQFAQCLDSIADQSRDCVFVEIGGGHSLSTLIRQHYPPDRKPVAVNVIRHPKEDFDDVQYFTGKLASLWESGIAVNWNQYFSGTAARRISLPTYAFEQNRFPAEVNPFDPALIGTTLSLQPVTQELRNWIYYPVWKSVTTSVNGRLNTVPERTALVFVSPDLACRELIGKLRGAGYRTIEVHAGSGFSKTDVLSYQIDPCKADDFHTLVADLHASSIQVSDVIYAWPTRIDSAKLTLSGAGLNTSLAYFSLIEYVRHSLRTGTLTGQRFYVITASLQKVLGSETGFCSQSLALAVANGLPQEYGVSACCIDVEPNDVRAAEGIFRILQGTDRPERLIALRNGKKWIQDYERNAFDVGTTTAFRAKGVYLITGGLGNVGFVLAQYLLREYNATVAILGRKDLQQNAEAATRFQQLRDAGNALYYLGDITRADELEAVIREIGEQHGMLNGVIHTAGNIDKNNYQLIEDITHDKAFALFAPKVLGILNLRHALQDTPLDFVWITSSIASELGGLGYTSYSAANLFMDYFVTTQQLPHWHVVRLGEMVFSPEEISSENGRRSALKPNELAGLFAWSVSQPNIPLMLETAIDLQSRLKNVYEVKKEAYLDSADDFKETDRYERPPLSTAFQAPETRLERELADVFEEFFGITGIGIRDNFFELGGDSLKGMMLLKRINNKLGISLPLTALFKGQDIERLAQFINEIGKLGNAEKRKSKMVI